MGTLLIIMHNKKHKPCLSQQTSRLFQPFMIYDLYNLCQSVNSVLSPSFVWIHAFNLKRVNYKNKTFVDILLKKQTKQNNKTQLVGWVGGASSCTPNGCVLNSGWGHLPIFRFLSWPGRLWVATVVSLLFFFFNQ